MKRMIKFQVVLWSLFLTVPLAGVAQQDYEINDPIEGFNRKIFWFNDKFDVYLMEPVARGYHSAVPDPIETGVGNFFNNLRYPTYLVSDIVQLKFGQVATHTGRFLVNSTIGILGFIDVAKDMGLPDHEEDFGIALAYHGVPAGPYLVLPFIGPSNVRDAVGLAVDTVLNPLYWITYTDLHADAKFGISAGLTALKYVDVRAGLIDAIETARESSVDYYLFLQGAYYQHRRGLLYDGNPPDDEDFEEGPNITAAQ